MGGMYIAHSYVPDSICLSVCLSQSSSASDVTGYHIMWVSDNGSDHDDVSETSTQFVQAIRCDVSYEYRVAAINPCGKGEFSASVEAMCGR